MIVEGQHFKSDKPSKILGVSGDAKTIKGEKKGFLTGVSYLAPHTMAGVGNVCAFADGCEKECLNDSGRAEFSNLIIPSRIRKTRLLFNDRDWYLERLAKDIVAGKKRAKKEGLTFVVRLNGTSDIPWENFGIMEKFPDTQFYDYSKNPLRMDSFLKGLMPKNYHLTFSRGGKNENEAINVLNRGGNVAVVFNTKKGKALPDYYKGFKVVDGDISDLRFLDEKNVVVGLRLKGRKNIKKNKLNPSSFVVDASNLNDQLLEG